MIKNWVKIRDSDLQVELDEIKRQTKEREEYGRATD